MKTGTKIRRTIAEIAIIVVIVLNVIYAINNPGDDMIIRNGFFSIFVIGLLMALWVGDPAMGD